MTLQPIKDIREYKRLKQTLQTRFEFDKTGEQNLFEDQTRILKPLLDASMQQKTQQKIFKNNLLLIKIQQTFSQKNYRDVMIIRIF